MECISINCASRPPEVASCVDDGDFLGTEDPTEWLSRCEALAEWDVPVENLLFPPVRLAKLLLVLICLIFGQFMDTISIN